MVRRWRKAPPAVDLIAALREKSLVHAAEDGRLALYLSIREFAAARLAERGLSHVVRLAHARALAGLAGRFNASRLLQDETPDPSLHAAVRREKPDLVSALAFVSTLPPSRARASLHVALAAAVAFLVAVPAEIAERELAAILADPGGLAPRDLAIVLLALQSALSQLGRFEEALAQTARVMALPGVPAGLAGFALSNAGVLLRARGDALAAWSYHERAARILEGEASLPRLAGMNTACMGRLQCDLSQPERARALNALAVELCDRMGDRWLAGLGLANLAQLEQEERNFERAEDLLTRALARFRETGEPQYEAIYAAICGGLYFEWGKLDLARRAYAAGEATLEALTLPFARAIVHGGRAALEALCDHPAEAAAHLDLARRQAARAPGAVARLIVEVHGGTVEIARAPAAAERAWRLRAEELSRGESADAALVRSNIDVRFAVRILARALATLCPRPAGAVLRAPPGALWFSVDGGPQVDLARRGIAPPHPRRALRGAARAPRPDAPGRGAHGLRLAERADPGRGRVDARPRRRRDAAQAGPARRAPHARRRLPARPRGARRGPVTSVLGRRLAGRARRPGLPRRARAPREPPALRREVGVADALHEGAEHAREVRLDLGPLAAQRERGRDGLERGDVLAPGLGAQLAVDRRLRRLEAHAVELVQPRVAPPQRLRLRPRAVEHHDALQRRGIERRAAPARDLIALRLAIGEEHGPPPRVDVLLAQRVPQAAPAQAHHELGLGQARDHDLRRAEEGVLLLRVLQDEDPTRRRVRHDAIAHARDAGASAGFTRGTEHGAATLPRPRPRASLGQSLARPRPLQRARASHTVTGGTKTERTSPQPQGR